MIHLIKLKNKFGNVRDLWMHILIINFILINFMLETPYEKHTHSHSRIKTDNR